MVNIGRQNGFCREYAIGPHNLTAEEPSKNTGAGHFCLQGGILCLNRTGGVTAFTWGIRANLYKSSSQMYQSARGGRWLAGLDEVDGAGGRGRRQGTEGRGAGGAKATEQTESAGQRRGRNEAKPME